MGGGTIRPFATSELVTLAHVSGARPDKTPAYTLLRFDGGSLTPSMSTFSILRCLGNIHWHPTKQGPSVACTDVPPRGCFAP
ncbi:hypothetical protein BKA70DRAFT_1424939 [Coprinopsis sp. MPI-PUGE-AT-0042]|nr:hypothetical protein BKA70DRAFT_1424939 [Coprinopsis sp. MPI-PUGE-AT-0042]